MTHKLVRIGKKEYRVVWADVKNGVLRFKAEDGSVWTTNRAFTVVEREK